ncbi:hypothetical protein Poli38472_007000 [Pythium oligandrum]|uniref:Uncharacterized protein n=1 Tax=Pythium oligandrum TaxID=41045 RepID=A0A8K1C9A6_PYTOL|nr:hypothetical protein Poli38472_007000 [Pythium oligandrum]|eukprot:TMW58855.1 hypothetical protein Poli38472_007000 [Pythium oligandrum]
MERQASSLRQGSKRVVAGNASFGASRRGEGAFATGSDESKRGYEDEKPPVSVSRFDPLETLGPSLLETLTLVHPPQPKSLQSQQDPGEDAAGDNNDSVQDEPGVSTEEEASRAKFDVYLSRSAVLGRLTDPSIDNARRVQETFAKMLEKFKCEATGVVLLQESTVLIFLETTADQFLEIGRYLQRQQSAIEPTTMKVLASCDDNPVRLLQGLYFRKISINRPASDAADWNEDALRQLAVDSFLNLVKFVKRIAPMPPAEIRKVLTNLSNTDQMNLPSNDFVLWLLAREDVMPLDEFLEIFDTPVMIELESERVWPVHPLLHY